MKKCIGIYLRLSLEDVDKRTNKAKDESNSVTAQRQLIQRHIEQNPYLWHGCPLLLRNSVLGHR